MPFQIIRNDITKVKADAIVNTANPEPTFASGTDGAIYKAAGEKKLLAERQKIGKIPRGDVSVTPAFKLQAKYIIHTVGPEWIDGKHGEFDVLRSCYQKSLDKAVELKCKSIAFPLIATGVYGFPKDEALEIALSVIQPFVLDHNIKVYMVVFDKSSLKISKSLIDDIQEYIDDNYVDETNSKYSYYRENRGRRGGKAHLGEIVSPEVDLSKLSIEQMISNLDKTFQEKLFEIIDERGLTGPQVYKGYVSKQVYSKLQADREYRPNKYTAIALCLSLHLNVEETQDMLSRAGWSLSPSSKADLIVKACIIKKQYNVVKIDIILDEFGCPELKNIK